MGGVVAYEMAQQLRAAGEAVRFLGLLETWPPAVAPMLSPELATRVPALAALVAERLRLYFETFKRLHGRERLRYVAGRLRVLADLVARRDLLRGTRGELARSAVTHANLRAFRRYVPRPYPDRAVLFWAEGRKVDPSADLRGVWLELVQGGVEVRTAPGDDSGLMLTEPHVRALATQLKVCLEGAQPSGSRPGGE